MSVVIPAAIPMIFNVLPLFLLGALLLLTVPNVQSYLQTSTVTHCKNRCLPEMGRIKIRESFFSVSSFTSFSLSATSSINNNNMKQLASVANKSTKISTEKNSEKIEKKKMKFVDGLQVKKIRYEVFF